MKTLGISLLILLFPLISEGWDYIHHGLDWTAGCQGAKESPIDISTAETAFDPTLGAIRFTNYDLSARSSANSTAVEFHLLNTGHTLEVEVDGGGVDSGKWPEVSGARLNGTYRLQQFHFHWGEKDESGSEHAVDGKRAPLELHLVHKNIKYKNMTEAIEHGDGIAVLAVLFTLDETDDVGSAWIREIMMHIDNVTDPTKDIKIPLHMSHPLVELLPVRRHLYYRYHGSLTTPPCTESVSWAVFHDRLPISHAHLDLFRTLVDIDGQMMVDNHRDITPRNNRTVSSSFLYSATTAMKSCSNGLSFIIVTLIIIIYNV